MQTDAKWSNMSIPIHVVKWSYTQVAGNKVKQKVNPRAWAQSCPPVALISRATFAKVSEPSMSIRVTCSKDTMIPGGAQLGQVGELALYALFFLDAFGLIFFICFFWPDDFLNHFFIVFLYVCLK